MLALGKSGLRQHSAISLLYVGRSAISQGGAIETKFYAATATQAATFQKPPPLAPYPAQVKSNGDTPRIETKTTRENEG